MYYKEVHVYDKERRAPTAVVRRQTGAVRPTPTHGYSVPEPCGRRKDGKVNTRGRRGRIK